MITINGRLHLIDQIGVVFQFSEYLPVQFENACEALLKCDVYFHGYEFKDEAGLLIHRPPQQIILPYVR